MRGRTNTATTPCLAPESSCRPARLAPCGEHASVRARCAGAQPTTDKWHPVCTRESCRPVQLAALWRARICSGMLRRGALEHPCCALLGPRDGLPDVAVREREAELAVGRRARRQALRVLVGRPRLRACARSAVMHAPPDAPRRPRAHCGLRSHASARASARPRTAHRASPDETRDILLPRHEHGGVGRGRHPSRQASLVAVTARVRGPSLHLEFTAGCCIHGCVDAVRSAHALGAHVRWRRQRLRQRAHRRRSPRVSRARAAPVAVMREPRLHATDAGATPACC
jgi:hypothetical protein